MTITINVIHHKPGDDEINKKLDFLINKIEQLMTVQERVDAALAGLNNVTNEIAADLKALKDAIAAGTVSEETVAKLEQNIAVLEAIAAEQ